MPIRRLSDATIERLPSYLRALRTMDAGTITSEQLATMTGVNSAKVRKDLSHFGFHGTRGVGYDVRAMRSKIERELGVTERLGVLIVGAGNLGRALANFGGFAPQGFRIVALCDSDPTKIGTKAGTVEVRPVEALEAIVTSERVGIGIIATPANVAQAIADRLIASGVTSLLNFAPIALQCPADVHIREVDLASELQILSFQMTQDQDSDLEAIAK